MTKPHEPPNEPEDTPYQRFERMVKKVMSVPKSKLDEREREWKQKRRKPT